MTSDVVVVDPCLLKDNKMSPRDHGVLIKKGTVVIVCVLLTHFCFNVRLFSQVCFICFIVRLFREKCVLFL